MWVDKSCDGVPESLMVKCNHLAFSLAAEYRVVVSGIHSEVDLQDSIVLCTLLLNTSENQAQELDSILGKLLFEQIPDYDPSQYWIGFAAQRSTLQAH
ncbi:hypothetical protein [Duganella radicis]|uniref:Uncharacterized protein n=1 Tax=Duganella radicis TaxID=551988 RepID=A0A6L6PPW5_9BURK|nr:hypothetical protein [Duganella radicis]MTV40671.1 hypothetical protein [Duganella radicis]